jgi:hypothetical protein
MHTFTVSVLLPTKTIEIQRPKHLRYQAILRGYKNGIHPTFNSKIVPACFT